jgi:biopolymer transport protein ExbD
MRRISAFFLLLVTGWMVSAEQPWPPSARTELAVTRPIHLRVRVQDGKTVIRMDDRVVALGEVEAAIRRRLATSDKELLLEHDEFTKASVLRQIIVSAKAAGLDRVQMVVP